MREVEFRAKENIYNNFVYSNGYYFDGINYWFLLPSENTALAFAKSVIIDGNTLSQYTGLKDKNGQKIFEGDIIREVDTNILYVVEWDDYGAMFLFHETTDKNRIDGMHFYDFEEYHGGLDVFIVGNSYENPELLEG